MNRLISWCDWTICCWLREYRDPRGDWMCLLMYPELIRLITRASWHRSDKFMEPNSTNMKRCVFSPFFAVFLWKYAIFRNILLFLKWTLSGLRWIYPSRDPTIERAIVPSTNLKSRNRENGRNHSEEILRNPGIYLNLLWKYPWNVEIHLAIRSEYFKGSL